MAWSNPFRRDNDNNDSNNPDQYSTSDTAGASLPPVPSHDQRAAMGGGTSSRKKCLAELSVFVVFGLALVIGLAVYYSQQKSGNSALDDSFWNDDVVNDVQPPAVAGDSGGKLNSTEKIVHEFERNERIRKELNVFTPPHALTDPTTPQYAAFMWITKEDPQQLTPDDNITFRQRYILATLYFSLTGQTVEEGSRRRKLEEDDNKQDELAEMFNLLTGKGNEEEGGSTNAVDELFNAEAEAQEGKEIELDQLFGDDNVVTIPERKGIFKDWLTGKSECEWGGVTCKGIFVGGDDESFEQLRATGDDSTKELASVLNLGNVVDNGKSGNGSSGANSTFSLPVVEVDLSGEELKGTIPEETGALASLVSLKLSNNQLKGGIPVTLGLLEHLAFLHLNHNELSGKIPESFGKLKKLEELFLQNNMIDGTMPGTLGNLTALSLLHLNNNTIDGEIPDSFGNLTSLVEFKLGYNNVTGNVPESVCALNLENFGQDFSYSLPNVECSCCGDEEEAGTTKPPQSSTTAASTKATSKTEKSNDNDADSEDDESPSMTVPSEDDNDDSGLSTSVPSEDDISTTMTEEPSADTDNTTVSSADSATTDAPLNATTAEPSTSSKDDPSSTSSTNAPSTPQDGTSTSSTKPGNDEATKASTKEPITASDESSGDKATTAPSPTSSKGTSAPQDATSTSSAADGEGGPKGISGIEPEESYSSTTTTSTSAP